MKVLHICNDFCGSKVHANLYAELDKQGIQQTVYTYYRDASLAGKNSFEGEATEFVYRPILSTYHRILYHKKIRDVYNDLERQLAASLQTYDLAHATTLFSDGAVALRLYKKYGVPYIVTVRNTDINEFLGYAPHTWEMGRKVLRGARKIVFISKAPMEKFCRHMAIKGLLSEISHKFVIQPNGIEDYWLDRVCVDEKNLSHNIIYVGKFDLNKNVVRLIKAVLCLRNNYPDIHLHIVGGDGLEQKKVLKLVDGNKECLTYHGKIFDKDKLAQLFRQCSIFAMPSIFETFGLVYIEALSQGLSVLYTKDQGIDGLLDERVGEKVNALSTQSIADGLLKMLVNRNNYFSHEVVDFEQFRWSLIAKRYMSLYESVLFGSNESYSK